MGTDLMCAGDLYENTSLDVNDQLRLLKSQGITFPCARGLCARRVLEEERTFEQLYMYRELFDRRVGGSQEGTYSNLDFSHLLRLARLDQHIRNSLLSLALDIEQTVRTRIVQEATRHHEDQYAIVQDYLMSLPVCEQRRRRAELKTAERNTYVAQEYKHHADRLPLQVYVELVSFGTLSDLYLFCARRWNDKEMQRNHYLLKSVRRMRNACAHGSPVLNGIARADANTGLDTHMVQAIAATGVSKRARSKHLRSERMRHLVTTLYTHNKLVTSRYAHARASKTLHDLAKELQANAYAITSSDSFNAFVAFLCRIISAWF